MRLIAGEGACKLKRYLLNSRFLAQYRGSRQIKPGSYISIIQIKGVHNAIDMLGTRNIRGANCTE